MAKAMTRIEQLRSRLSRIAALVGGETSLVGALAGIESSFAFSMESFWRIPIASVSGGLLAAVSGDRVLPLFHRS